VAAAAAVLAGVLLNAQTPAPPSASGELPLVAPPNAVQTIVIDPGHGGDDPGVTAESGIFEKQLTLDVARRIKALVESRLGVRVILTREDDRTLPLDERAVIANNSRANLFLSLHFNASLSPSVSGAQVYYQSLDREGEAALQAMQNTDATMTLPGGGTRSISFVRWDLAQIRHLDRSAALAAILVDVMGRARIPMGARPLQQAPLRGLAGVNMPAALLELAYLTNPTQAVEVTSAEFQGTLAQAVYDGLLRFRGAPGEER
jgi:N-acetylmuramoyl-L-alanine amidase